MFYTGNIGKINVLLSPNLSELFSEDNAEPNASNNNATEIERRLSYNSSGQTPTVSCTKIKDFEIKKPISLFSAAFPENCQDEATLTGRPYNLNYNLASPDTIDQFKFSEDAMLTSLQHKPRHSIPSDESASLASPLYEEINRTTTPHTETPLEFYAHTARMRCGSWPQNLNESARHLLLQESMEEVPPYPCQSLVDFNESITQRKAPSSGKPRKLVNKTKKKRAKDAEVCGSLKEISARGSRLTADGNRKKQLSKLKTHSTPSKTKKRKSKKAAKNLAPVSSSFLGLSDAEDGVAEAINDFRALALMSTEDATATVSQEELKRYLYGHGMSATGGRLSTGRTKSLQCLTNLPSKPESVASKDSSHYEAFVRQMKNKLHRSRSLPPEKTRLHPEKRRSVMRFALTDNAWQVCNNSKVSDCPVPTASSKWEKYGNKPFKKSLDTATLENIGTRLSSPVHLLRSRGPNYKHVRSKMWWVNKNNTMDGENFS